mmetsp:Transcript_28331/g.27274  ORF Transcript_28331/g.27274 Transcript_28331/m.27274 type:complete len:181 (+) Transcript_28331:171-713(+)
MRQVDFSHSEKKQYRQVSENKLNYADRSSYFQDSQVPNYLTPMKNSMSRKQSPFSKFEQTMSSSHKFSKKLDSALSVYSRKQQSYKNQKMKDKALTVLLEKIMSREERKINPKKELQTNRVKRELLDAENRILQVSPNAVTLPQLYEELFDQMRDDEVLLDGELMRYNPGFKYQYMNRFC